MHAFLRRAPDDGPVSRCRARVSSSSSAPRATTRRCCARYNPRDLTQLVFHARNDGFDFTAEDVADVVGALEASVIVAKDGDPFDATSRLWRRMWGGYHLEYLRRQRACAGTPTTSLVHCGQPMSAPSSTSCAWWPAGRTCSTRLKVRGKDDVLAAAADLGFAFTESRVRHLRLGRRSAAGAAAR